MYTLEDVAPVRSANGLAVPLSDAERQAIADGWNAASQPTLADFDRALTAHLDKTAQARRYDNRITCMVRAGFVGPFQAEAVAFAQWADACNAQAYQWLAQVQAGTLTLPQSTQEFIDLLPPMVWPV
jgi:hypothetical protein